MGENQRNMNISYIYENHKINRKGTYGQRHKDKQKEHKKKKQQA